MRAITRAMRVWRELSIAPEPLEVARRVADRPGVALLYTASGAGPSYVMCDPVGCASGLDPEPDLALAATPEPFAHVPRWLGVLPYESRRFLERKARRETRPEPFACAPRWWRYAAVAEIGERVVVVGDDAPSATALAALLERPARSSEVRGELRPAEARGLHVARVQRALEYIRAGELYQVNLARLQRLALQGHALDVLARLCARAPAPYAAALCTPDYDVIGTSPELFLRLEPDRRLSTAPIKGTRPRGRDAAEDVRLIAALEHDAKERAELTMIIDVERNDLGRVAEVGSVRVSEGPHVSTYGSVHHRWAKLEARLRPGVSRSALLEALLPSGSVTGAPKLRAMEIIAELEAHRRGLYTGAYGFLSHAGGLELGMAIRTLCRREGEAEYFAGGGIVADSDPLREYEETHWKAVQLAALLG
ncbi:MAG TPA: anthranilate synthase component I family protein [Polyangiaceae bacterium]|nr:anthranilate synthase component I family protein [Polyangiaceae bacterium]